MRPLFCSPSTGRDTWRRSAPGWRRSGAWRSTPPRLAAAGWRRLPITGHRFARDEDIEASIAVFRRHFPQGRVMASPDNLGVARNILRGERLVFEGLEQDLGYFFEDDLEPGPWYVWALERLRELTEPFPRVAYFGAYGDHRRNYPGPLVKYIPLEHHWGFALRRHAWMRMMEWLKPFYALLEGRDYRDRDHARIFRLYEPLVVGSEASSQDAAKSLACMELNLTRVMTNVSFGRYIGEEGHSFSPTASAPWASTATPSRRASSSNSHP
ncbi:hypothetical protein ACFQU7_12375 [Pseudoroseomonas wenyumeiae]